MERSLKIPVLILGGGTGGVAAAMALAREHIKCAIVESTIWLGGQLTSQAVPPDENKWIEGKDGIISATKSYRQFRALVRDYYKTHFDLVDHAANDPYLNPGGGWVSRLCFEPRIGHRVLMDMLGPFMDRGLIQTFLRCEPVAAQTLNDTVRSVTCCNLDDGEEFTVESRLILEATETGDLYPLADIEHSYGAEHRDVFNELHGRTDHTDPMDQQAITWCFAMENRPGEDHTIAKPKQYDAWRIYKPDLSPPWIGPLFSWDICNHDFTSRTLNMNPWPDEPNEDCWELWRYRRIVDRSIHAKADTTPPEVTLFNCVQMDYFKKPLLGVSESDKQTALREAREQSLCFFYWMQTEAPRHDNSGQGYPGLKMRGDELGSADGFALAPYIREPRRLDARTIITEAHVGQEQRLVEGNKPLNNELVVAGEPFKDSIGIGHYPIDLHPSTAMCNSLYIPASPFRIPLGALLPKRVSNVIAAGKALGVTHIANGCTRLHPIEWNIGESAGTLAAMCIQHNLDPHQVHKRLDLIRGLQETLIKRGIPLAWPWEDA